MTDTATKTLTIRDLRLARGGRRLIDGLSFGVDTGECVSVSGPSGSGKSTLLRAIAGLINPDAGSLSLHQASPETLGWPVYRSRVIYVQQQPVFTAATVRGDLARPFGYAVRALGTFDQAEALTLLELLLLPSSVLDTRPETLSVGERQRIALVRALLLDPEFLLLDEPASALDDDAARAVADLLRTGIEDKSLGIVMTAHGESAIDPFVTRHIDIGKGANHA